MMRRWFILIIIAGSFSAFSQLDASSEKATVILNKVSKRYKSLISIKATVNLRTVNKDSDIDLTNVIELLKKGNKFKFSMDNILEVISDNESIWTISPEDKEVTIDVFEEDPDDEEINLSNVFTIYENGFEHYYIEDKTTDAAVKCHVIDLIPEDKEKDYFKIRVLVDSEESLLNQMNIFYKDGTHAIYYIKEFYFDEEISDTNFQVKKEDYTGYHFEDLR